MLGTVLGGLEMKGKSPHHQEEEIGLTDLNNM